MFFVNRDAWAKLLKYEISWKQLVMVDEVMILTVMGAVVMSIQDDFSNCDKRSCISKGNGGCSGHGHGKPGICSDLERAVIVIRVSEPEPGYLAGAGAVTLARLRLHLKYLFNNSRKLHGT